MDARAYVLEMFRDVTPAGAASAIDSLLEARQELQANRWGYWADYVLYGSPEFVLKMASS